MFLSFWTWALLLTLSTIRFSLTFLNIARDYGSGVQVVYLADRTQTFQVGLDRSIAFVIDCSVPQSSVLGPLKFVVYTENFQSVIEKHELADYLYADNTQIADHLQLTQAAVAITNIDR